MDSTDTRPHLCQNCPLLPEGVTAVLAGAHTINMGELRRYKFANDAPDLAQLFVGMVRARFEVVASRNAAHEVGAEQTLLVKNTNPQRIGGDILGCPGPRRRRCGCLQY